MSFELTLPYIPGFLQYSIKSDRVHIDWLEIDHNYQNQGYATKLITQLLEDYPKASVTPVPLTDDFTHPQLRQFYKKRKFIYTHTTHPGDLFTYPQQLKIYGIDQIPTSQLC